LVLNPSLHIKGGTEALQKWYLHVFTQTVYLTLLRGDINVFTHQFQLVLL